MEGANDYKFWAAVERQELRGAFSLLSHDVNPNTVHEVSGSTPLHVACQEGNCAMAMLLFTKGGLVNTADKAGQTPLHLAAAGGHGQIVIFLVKAGADMGIQNGKGQTAEELATQQNQTAVARFLQNARLGGKKEVVNGKATLRKEEKGKEREHRQLERQERKLVDKDQALKQELLELSVEKTRLEAIPPHLVTKKEQAALALVDRQLSKLEIKHQKYINDIREVRRSSYETQETADKKTADPWHSFLAKVSFT